MDKTLDGWLSGFVGMLIFSGSLPATRLGLVDLSPVFFTAARAVVAGFLAILVLGVARQHWPARRDIGPLIVVAIGVVVGFPLLTALALQHVTAAHAMVFVGILPLSTAFFGVLRGGERPRPIFWVFSGLGSALVAGFALRQGVSAASVGDLWMLASIVVCGLGYAQLARRLGGWQVISWALVLSLPIMLSCALASMPRGWSGIGAPALLSLAYVSIFSMLIGFVFWYRGLAKGGIAAVGQLQLLQPFFGLMLAAFVLGESVGWPILAVSCGVALCVAGARRFAG